MKEDLLKAKVHVLTKHCSHWSTVSVLGQKMGFLYLIFVLLLFFFLIDIIWSIWGENAIPIRKIFILNIIVA